MSARNDNENNVKARSFSRMISNIPKVGFTPTEDSINRMDKATNENHIKEIEYNDKQATI